MITAELLKQVPLFAGLPENERASLAARAADVRLQADEWLVVEGQTPSFFALLEGRITVFKSIAGHEQAITSFVPGDYSGEVALLLGSPALASLRATEPSRVARLEGADFLDLISHCRTLNGEILKTMAKRIGTLQQLAVETPASAVTVIGYRLDVACHDIRDFLSRNHVPFHWLDVEDPACRERLPEHGFACRPERRAFGRVILAPACFRSSSCPTTVG
jgi:thioredoxin reductase (NADPH)